MKPSELKSVEGTETDKPGIYLIINTETGKGYVGQTKRTIHTRFLIHKNTLLRNKHRNPHLQASYNKYGEYSFSYLPLENCQIENLTKRETYYHNLIDAELRYNLAGIKDSHVMSQYTRDKIRQALTGIKRGPMSEEQKQLFSRIRKGKPNIKLRGRKSSDEHRKKLSEAHMGKPNNSSTKFKKGESIWIGRKHSAESKLKMAESRKKYLESLNNGK